jgi:hypothetical protein
MNWTESATEPPLKKGEGRSFAQNSSSVSSETDGSTKSLRTSASPKPFSVGTKWKQGKQRPPKNRARNAADPPAQNSLSESSETWTDPSPPPNHSPPVTEFIPEHPPKKPLPGAPESPTRDQAAFESVSQPLPQNSSSVPPEILTATEPPSSSRETASCPPFPSFVAFPPPQSVPHNFQSAGSEIPQPVITEFTPAFSKPPVTEPPITDFTPTAPQNPTQAQPPTQLAKKSRKPGARPPPSLTVPSPQQTESPEVPQNGTEPALTAVKSIVFDAAPVALPARVSVSVQVDPPPYPYLYPPSPYQLPGYFPGMVFPYAVPMYHPDVQHSPE